MSEHAVVIAGGGPTGMMLAAELALAGSTSSSSSGAQPGGGRARAPAGCTPARSRCSTSGGSPIGSSPRARRCRSRASPESRSTSATSHPPPLRPRPVAEPHRAHPGRVGRRAGRADPYRARGDGLRAGRRRRRRPAGAMADAARRLRRRLRRRTQRVRKAAGIEFPGGTRRSSSMIAEVEMEEDPEFGIRHDERRHARHRRRWRTGASRWC